jgi:hypothetical protein
MKDVTKVADDIFMVPWYEGNGVIRREIWVGPDRKAIHYYLAYFNLDYFAGDNGRVIGLEYKNGALKTSLLGEETAGSFVSLEELEERFEQQWNDLPKQSCPPGGQSSEQSGGISADDTGDYPEQKQMMLTIAKGDAADFFKRGRKLAAKIELGEEVKPEKIILFGHRHELCYTIREQ